MESIKMFLLLSIYSTTLIIVSVVFSVIIIAITIGIVTWFAYKNKRKTEESLKRLPEVDYTQIIGSSGGETGSVVTYGNSGANFGAYSSAPTTKFLVVYLNGENEIVSVLDNSKLCKEYLLKLKK